MKSLLALVVLAAIGAGGCDSRSPEHQLQQRLQEIRSWSAASRMVVGMWQRRAVPTHYALDTLEEAQKGVGEQIQQVSQMNEVAASARDRARAIAGQLRQACGAMRDAVRRSDGGAAERERVRAGQIEETLGELTRSQAAGR